MQLATLLIGLISATALWSGVQALNQQARSSYDRAAATFGGSRVPMMLKPEERRDWVIPIAIGNELKPGEYVMKTSRNFKANGKWFVMHSNSLRVSIK